jgi:ribosome recycling factor
MSASVKQQCEEKMEKALASFKRDLASMRAGRASASLLDKVQAEYYGALTPVNQLGSITTPDARTLIIQPWDKSVISPIEKAIMKSDLGLMPSNDGVAIRITMPILTEQRRQELVKVLRKSGEEAKVNVRNIRRDANDEIKKLEKNGASEDEARRMQEDVQKLTDKYITEIDKALQTKEKEMMEV